MHRGWSADLAHHFSLCLSVEIILSCTFCYDYCFYYWVLAALYQSADYRPLFSTEKLWPNVFHSKSGAMSISAHFFLYFPKFIICQQKCIIKYHLVTVLLWLLSYLTLWALCSLPVLPFVPLAGEHRGTSSRGKGQDDIWCLVMGRTWSQVVQKQLVSWKERRVQWDREPGAATSEFWLPSGQGNLTVSLSPSPSLMDVVVFHFTHNLGVT